MARRSMTSMYLFVITLIDIQFERGPQARHCGESADPGGDARTAKGPPPARTAQAHRAGDVQPNSDATTDVHVDCNSRLRSVDT